MLGKEFPIVPPRTSRTYVVALALALSVWLAKDARAIEVAFNGAVAARESALEDAHIVAASGASLFAGVPLGEVVPLVAELHEIRVSFRDGSSQLIRPPDDNLFAWTLVPSDSGWRLTGSDETTKAGVTRVDVRAVRLDASSLSVWLSWEGIDTIESEIARFAEHFGVEVDSSTVPNTRAKLVATERARGVPADVAMIQSDYLPDLVEAGAIQPVAPFTRLEPSPGVNKGRAAFADDRYLWAEPFYFDSHVVLYNPELTGGSPDFASWNRDGFTAFARRSRGEVRAAWNAYSAYWLTPFVLGFGKEAVVDPDLEYVRVDDEATRDALYYVLRLVEDGTLTVMERDAMTSYFVAGRAALILTGSYALPGLDSLGVPYEVAPYPEGIVPFLDFKGFAVSRRSRNPILARRFLEYFATPAIQARVAGEIFKMPANHHAFPLVAGRHRYTEVLEMSYERGVPVPNQRAYTVYKDLMWRMLRFLFAGQMDIDQMLERSDALILNATRNG